MPEDLSSLALPPEEVAGVTVSHEPVAAQVNKAFWLLFSESLCHKAGLTTVRFPSEVVPRSIMSLVFVAKTCCVRFVRACWVLRLEKGDQPVPAPQQLGV